MALTRITKGVIKPNENYDTHNIVSTGIVTSVGLDVNGNADISGSLSVGGVLTYEDVTSIDSIGIITARTGLVSPYADIDDFVSVGSNIHLGNAGVITATSFVGSGAALTGIDATAIKDSGGNVKIQAQASGAMHTGIHTFSSGAEVGSNIKLGNAGVITATSFVGSGAALTGIDATAVKDSGGNVKIQAQASGAVYTGIHTFITLKSTSGTFTGDIDVDGHTNLDNLSVAGVSTFAGTLNASTVSSTAFIASGDLDVDGHTFLDNVSIAGVTTVSGILDATNTPASIRVAQDIQHKGDADTKITFPAADQISFETGGSNRLKIHTYSSNNNVEVDASSHLSLADNGSNGRFIYIGDGDASSTGYMHLQPGGGSQGFGGGIRLYSHSNSTNAGGVYIGKSHASSGAIIFGNGGMSPLNEYLRINASGHVVPGADSTYDLGLTGTRFRNVYADTLYGDGSNLTGVSGVTINNNANNRLITGSGTANTLEGESSLTFDGTTLTTNGSGGINISYSGADLTMNSAGTIFTGNGGNATDPIVRNVSDTNTGFFYPSADTLAFTTGGSERMRLSAGGTGVANVIIGGTNATTHSNVDQLVIGSTSGTNGITIKSGTSSYGCLYFHDEDTTNTPKGQIEYQHGTEQMSFYANQQRMMRIDGDEDEGQLRFTPNVTFSGTRNTNIVRETFILNTSESSNQAYHDNHHMSFGQTQGNWQEGTGGADTSWGLMWHYAANASATRQCRAGIAFDHKSSEQFKIWSAYGDIVFYQDLANGGSETAETCDTECARFDANGHFVPGSNNARDLGTSSKKWRNIYVMDMHFSNEGGSPNSVDGTTGNWTLQEGEDGIYMINNKNGKKYEMMLKEVQ